MYARLTSRDDPACTWASRYQPSFRMTAASRSEDLAPTQKGSLDADILEPIQIAGQRIFIEHNHVSDLADLERSVSVLVPGQPVAALHRQPQRLLPAELTVSKLSLAILVPALTGLPPRPQHGIRRATSRKPYRYAASQHAPDGDAVAAKFIEAVAIACHPQEARHHRGDDAERLHAADLRVARLIDMDHDPAAIPDRHLLVDRLVRAQGVFEITADHAIHAQPEPGRLGAEHHETLRCHRLVEMPRPLIVGIAPRDDVRDRGVGVAAKIIPSTRRMSSPRPRPPTGPA